MQRKLALSLSHLHKVTELRPRLFRPALHGIHCRGLALMEVLVALLLVGMVGLGALGLQMASLQAAQHARWLATATYAAQELAEVMRSHPAPPVARTSWGFMQDLYSHTTLAAPSCGIPGRSACTSAATAIDRDLALWWSRIQNTSLGGLPNARARICWDDANPAPLQWECNPQGPLLAIKLGWSSPSTMAHPTEEAAAPQLLLTLDMGWP